MQSYHRHLFRSNLAMSERNDLVAETVLHFQEQGGGDRRVHVTISKPVLGTDDGGAKAWLCNYRLDGLYDIEKPVFGDSSLEAILMAVSDIYILLRDEVGASKVYQTGGLLGDDLLPQGGASLKELFGLDGM